MKTAEQRLKILLVPDFHAWVTGTIAQQIALHCHGVEAIVCSDPGYRLLLSRYGTSVFSGFDLIHFLDAQLSARHGFQASQSVPIVCTINHYENQSSVACARFADRIMTLCNQQKERIVEAGVSSERIATVRVGCDRSVFHEPTTAERVSAKMRLGFQERQIVVGFVAKKALSGRKGADILERAIQAIASQDTSGSYGFLIVGPGWSDLVENLRGRGVSVYASTYVDDYRSLVPLYQAMDVFWVTSRLEGGPLPLLEAMSCGVYSITTRVGIAEELINNGNNGVFVPFDDPSKLVEETRRFAASSIDEQQRLSRAAAQKVDQHWQWCHVTQGAYPMYQEAIRVGRKRIARNVQKRKADRTNHFPGWSRQLAREAMACDTIAFAEHLDMMGEGSVANAFRRRQIVRDPFGPATLPLLRVQLSKSRVGGPLRWLRRQLNLLQIKSWFER